MEWLSAEFVAQNGIGVFAFAVMAWLFVRQQNIIKESEAGQVAARMAETAQQDKILAMYAQFGATMEALRGTLEAQFGQIHKDRDLSREAIAKNTAGIEQQTAGIGALTEKIGSLETAMTEHNEAKPSIEDLMKAIEELGAKVDSVDRNVTEIKEEFQLLRSQAENVKKATSENPVVETPVAEENKEEPSKPKPKAI